MIMMENFDFTKVPTGYQLCFHGACPLRDECVRYLAGQHVPATLEMGMAVYPTAYHDGQCAFFRHNRVQRMAWGFGGIYLPLKSYLRAPARTAVCELLGSEGTYYRYHHGQRKLSPEQQEGVKRILREFGYNGEVQFEHYEDTYDFGV